jgi:hypothetical protein
MMDPPSPHHSYFVVRLNENESDDEEKKMGEGGGERYYILIGTLTIYTNLHSPTNHYHANRRRQEPGRGAHDRG